MSEYELSLMRQRGIAARDSKAKRGEFRFMLPPGLCWGEAGKIEIDPDEHVADTIRLVFAKFRELGSARQVFLWLRSADIKMPIVLRNVDVCKLVWNARLSQRHADSPQSDVCEHMPLAGGRSEHGLSMGALERPVASQSPKTNGTSCCATIILATSAGRSMRTTRSSCLRTRT